MKITNAYDRWRGRPRRRLKSKHFQVDSDDCLTKHAYRRRDDLTDITIVLSIHLVLGINLQLAPGLWQHT
jgi:hypothetical protein